MLARNAGIKSTRPEKLVISLMKAVRDAQAKTAVLLRAMVASSCTAHHGWKKRSGVARLPLRIDSALVPSTVIPRLNSDKRNPSKGTQTKHLPLVFPWSKGTQTKHLPHTHTPTLEWFYKRRTIYMEWIHSCGMLHKLGTKVT